MPYLFEFDSVHRVFRCRMSGRVTDEELQQYYKTAARYIERTNPLGAILDFTAVTSFEVSSATIKSIAHSPPNLPDPLVPRFLVAPSTHVYGMARMFQMLGEGTRPNLHVVRSLAEAQAALRIGGEDFKPIED
jgi:hypothetical protein